MTAFNYRMITTLIIAACWISRSNQSPINQEKSLHEASTTSLLDPYPALGKPRLTFKRDGTFKITVFSDLHFGEIPLDESGPQHDASSLKLMNRVLADEKPDYAVVNGDLIHGEHTFKENATTLIDKIVGPFNNARVPFSTTHGNHDNQPNINHYDEILREQKTAPRYSYTRLAPKGVGGESGQGNYWVPVYSSILAPTPSLILWFFDSRGGVRPNATATKDAGIAEPIGVPAWVDESVATWVTTETRRMEEAWGSAAGRGALAFVHIPPNIIRSVQSTVNSVKNPGLNDDVLGTGSVQAGDDPTKGDPFWNALTSRVKNLHAIISGHAHGNEWCARELAKDVVFCFNKHSGYGGYGKDGWGYGVRDFLFTSPNPRVPPQTWIRLEEGETRARVTLGNAYGRD